MFKAPKLFEVEGAIRFGMISALFSEKPGSPCLQVCEMIVERFGIKPQEIKMMTDGLSELIRNGRIESFKRFSEMVRLTRKDFSMRERISVLENSFLLNDDRDEKFEMIEWIIEKLGFTVEDITAKNFQLMNMLAQFGSLKSMKWLCDRISLDESNTTGDLRIGVISSIVAATMKGNTEIVIWMCERFQMNRHDLSPVFSMLERIGEEGIREMMRRTTTEIEKRIGKETIRLSIVSRTVRQVLRWFGLDQVNVLESIISSLSESISNETFLSQQQVVRGTTDGGHQSQLVFVPIEIPFEKIIQHVMKPFSDVSSMTTSQQFIRFCWSP